MAMNRNEVKIDIVITWVDGNDPKWINERKKYISKSDNNASSDNRFRDWDLMRYWFRGIEKYASWVNHIFFITCGHYPEWLDLSNPKLTLVKHSDYIPQELLPTFNSNTIEMYIHNIKELSEHFVLFNDDMFLISETYPNDFFQNGLPCESGLLGVLSSQDIKDVFPHILVNNNAIINKYFCKKEVLRKYRNKFFSYKYGKDIIRNIALLPFVYFSDFRDLHITSAHLKSTFVELWRLEPNIMYCSTKEKIRSQNDVNHWLLKSWNMCKGNFVPRKSSFGKKFELGVDDGVYDYITKHKGKVVCINDSKDDIQFDEVQKKLKESFEKILSEKSSFEK